MFVKSLTTNVQYSSYSVQNPHYCILPSCTPYHDSIPCYAYVLLFYLTLRMLFPLAILKAHGQPHFCLAQCIPNTILPQLTYFSCSYPTILSHTISYYTQLTHILPHIPYSILITLFISFTVILF